MRPSDSRKYSRRHTPSNVIVTPRAPPSLVVPMLSKAPAATIRHASSGAPESMTAATSTGAPRPPDSNQSLIRTSHTLSRNGYAWSPETANGDQALSASSGHASGRCYASSMGVGARERCAREPSWHGARALGCDARYHCHPDRLVFVRQGDAGGHSCDHADERVDPSVRHWIGAALSARTICSTPGHGKIDLTTPWSSRRRW